MYRFWPPILDLRNLVLIFPSPSRLPGVPLLAPAPKVINFAFSLQIQMKNVCYLAQERKRHININKISGD